MFHARLNVRLSQSVDRADAEFLDIIFGEAMQELSIEELGGEIFFLYYVSDSLINSAGTSYFVIMLRCHHRQLEVAGFDQ